MSKIIVRNISKSLKNEIFGRKYLNILILSKLSKSSVFDIISKSSNKNIPVKYCKIFYPNLTNIAMEYKI